MRDDRLLALISVDKKLLISMIRTAVNPNLNTHFVLNIVDKPATAALVVFICNHLAYPHYKTSTISHGAMR